MNKIKVTISGDTMTIGDAPQLIVDLKNQNNYIAVQGKKIPYKREVVLSKDLLNGKRRNVYETAVRYYYDQACQIAKGIQIAEAYRPVMNTVTREIK